MDTRPTTLVSQRDDRVRATGGEGPTRDVTADAVRFAPEAIFAALNAAGVDYVVIGGIAAVLHGSPLRTGDADVCPERGDANLERLATALTAINADIRTDRGEVVATPWSGTLIGNAEMWNLTTSAGDLDIAFRPAGTSGYDELVADAATYELEGGVRVVVASLADVIRSKEAAGRPKDREALPVLRELQREQDET
jgi:hypothetical protein